MMQLLIDLNYQIVIAISSIINKWNLKFHGLYLLSWWLCSISSGNFKAVEGDLERFMVPKLVIDRYLVGVLLTLIGHYFLFQYCEGTKFIILREVGIY